MTRMRNKATGAVVNVTAEKSKRLGSEWVSAEKSKPEPKPKK